MIKPYPPTPMPGQNRLVIRPVVSLMLLGCLFVFFLMATAFIMQFLIGKIPNQAGALRIGAVVQDLLIFVIPAIATAMVSTRLPARLLLVDNMPRLNMLLLTLIVMLVSVPAMNMLVEWNDSVTLPQSLSAIANEMRAMEESAQKSVELLMGGTSVGSLIVSILIIGIMAGFSEELFFRGALQRLLSFSLNIHVAIWLSAFIFSAFHLQFFGFFPRFLLGAFFGYLLYWSGSLWLPVAAHVFNNSLVAIVQWLRQRETLPVDVDKIGSQTSDSSEMILFAVSLILTIVGIILIARMSQKKN
ncbi:MAG: CPBP family intramembrane metalloprotease [Muribaculaceae bacterium]|nr:CPBP family intramembrane metalloprotease [Muribaculaceae bacterium]MDE6809861.1 CPBP family intramembrane metalloprotease [Muribaculaceae bacterium]